MDYFLENQIEELIKNTVLAEDPEQEIWSPPHFATASISDREFGKLRTWVHEDHLMPGDLLPGAESVISFFLPFTPQLSCSSNEGVPPSRSPEEADLKTRVLLERIKDEITMLLEAGGFNCGSLPVDHDFDKKDLTSRWSHKHIAWLCGLDSFGRNNMPITDSGSSGRVWSLVTDAPLASTPFPE